MEVNGAKTMEYKYKKGDKRTTPMDQRRKDLAKKKADIIKGQNSQTAAGSAGARMESLKGASASTARSGRL